MQPAPESAFERFRTSSSPEALGEVFDALGPRLLGLAGHLAGPRGGPEDLVQATFLEAIQHAHRWDASRPLLPWLVGILIRLHRAERRKGARVIEADRLVERAEAGPLEQIEQEELAEAIAVALESLPEAYRSALVLRLVHGFTPPQIARALGRPLETVRSQLRRGRELLRDALPESVGPAALAAIGAWLPAQSDALAADTLRSELLRRAAELAPIVQTAAAAGVAAPSLLASLATLIVMKHLLLAAGALLIGAGLWFTLRPAGEGSAPQTVAAGAPAEAVGLQLDERSALPEANAVNRVAERRTEDAANTAAVAAQVPTPPDTRLTGRVLLPDGAPAGETDVRLLNRPLAGYKVLDLVENRRLDPVAVARTDEQGCFGFDVAPARAYRLELAASGCARLVREPVFGGEHLELKLDPGATLLVEARSAETGLPAFGARVNGWIMGRPGKLFEAETDTAGRLRLDHLPEALLTLEVEPLELASAPWRQVALVAGQETTAVFELERGLTVSGRVTDERTGAPIADAVIGAGWTYDRPVRSDLDGRYTLPGFGGPGVYSIHARADGHGESSEGFDPSEMPKEDLELHFALPPARSAFGRVVDSGGRPLAGVVLSTLGADRVTDWRTARSADDGNFRLESLDASGRHQLLVRGLGYGIRVLEFPHDELERSEIDLGDIVLRSPARASGVVRALDGRPLPGLEIALIGVADGRFELAERRLDELRSEDFGSARPELPTASGTGYSGERKLVTDSRGRFHFDDVAAGAYWLRCSFPGSFRRQAATLSFRIESGVDRTDLELQVDAGLPLAGRVIDARGEGVAGANAVVYQLDEEGDATRVASVDTEAAGAFELLPPGAAPGTTLWIVAEARLLRHSGREDVANKGLPRSITEARAQFELRLPEPAFVLGRVLDATGEPIPGARVRARCEPSLMGLDSVETGADGAFELEVPAGGTFTVVATRMTEDGWVELARSETVRPGTGVLELRQR